MAKSPKVVLCACWFLYNANDTRALIGLCLLVMSHLGQIPDHWHSQVFTITHILIGLSLHIHSFIHLSFGVMNTFLEFHSGSRCDLRVSLSGVLIYLPCDCWALFYRVMVKMKNLLNQNTWLWERGKFMNRRFLMQVSYMIK